MARVLFTKIAKENEGMWLGEEGWEEDKVFLSDSNLVSTVFAIFSCMSEWSFPNFPKDKNDLGLFKNPECVVLLPEFLTNTLSDFLITKKTIVEIFNRPSGAK